MLSAICLQASFFLMHGGKRQGAIFTLKMLTEGKKNPRHPTNVTDVSLTKAALENADLYFDCFSPIDHSEPKSINT